MLGVAFGAGFVFGPALGGLAGAVDPRLPFWIAAGAQPRSMGFTACSSCRNRCRANGARRSRGAAPIRSARSSCCARIRELFGLASVNFLGSLAHASLPSIAVLYMMYRYGWDERAPSASRWRGVGVCAMIVQGGLIGPTVKRFGERTTLIIGLGVRRSRVSRPGAWRRPALFFWLGIPLMALWGFANAASLGLMSRRVGAERAGPVAGRQCQPHGHRQSVRPGLFTQTFALFIGPAHRLASAGRAVPAGGAAPGLRCRVAWRTTR